MLKKVSIENTPEDPEIGTRPGWEGMRVWWLTAALDQLPTQVVINVTQFPPGVMHEIHRHPHAEEFVYILKGTAVQLTPEGESLQQAGELVVVPRNTWHGLRNDGPDPVLLLAGYAGVPTADDAGYEVLEVEAGGCGHDH